MTIRLVVCVNFRPFSGQPSCAQRGSRELAEWLEQSVRERSLDVTVERIVCMGHCQNGPNVKVMRGDMMNGADQEKLTELLDQIEAGTIEVRE